MHLNELKRNAEENVFLSNFVSITLLIPDLSAVKLNKRIRFIIIVYGK